MGSVYQGNSGVYGERELGSRWFSSLGGHGGHSYMQKPVSLSISERRRIPQVARTLQTERCYVA